MTDRPIMFGAPVVRPLLDGTKTQSRRVLKAQPTAEAAAIRQIATDKATGAPVFNFYNDSGSPIYAIPFKHGLLGDFIPRYAIGDRLWVRETWAVGNIYDGVKPRDINPDGKPNWCGIRYKATDHRLGIHDRPSIHMPRWASRLTLIVSDVRVERLQDISEEDAIAEGVRRILPAGHADDKGPYHFAVDTSCGSLSGTTAKDAFAALWNHINGPEAWEANPWVVAVSFEVHQSNIDQLVLEQKAA